MDDETGEGKDEDEEETCVSECVNVPLCCFQSQGEVFSPDGGCLAMRTVVSCVEQRLLLWFRGIFNIKT